MMGLKRGGGGTPSSTEIGDGQEKLCFLNWPSCSRKEWRVKGCRFKGGERTERRFSSGGRGSEKLVGGGQKETMRSGGKKRSSG